MLRLPAMYTDCFLPAVQINNTIDRNFIHSLSVAFFRWGFHIWYQDKYRSEHLLQQYHHPWRQYCNHYLWNLRNRLAGNDNKLYFNTVYIGGSPASGTNRSYALYSAVNTNTRDFRNNIFANARSTAGGTNLHYAVYIASTGGTITCNYNDYWVSGTGRNYGILWRQQNNIAYCDRAGCKQSGCRSCICQCRRHFATDYIPGNCTLAAASIPGVTK